MNKEGAGGWTAPVLPTTCRLIAAYGASWKGDSAFLTQTGQITTPSFWGRQDAQMGREHGRQEHPSSGCWVPSRDAASRGTRWPRCSRYLELLRAALGSW